MSQRFDSVSGHYELVFDADGSVMEPTEIYVPRIHYPGGFEVAVNGRPADIAWDDQIVRLPRADGRTSLKIRRAQ